MYSINDKSIKHTVTLQYPCAIDLDIKESLLYVGANGSVTLFNLNETFTPTSSWKLPVVSDNPCWGLKLDGPIVYLTIRGAQQIFICNTRDGQVIKKNGELLQLHQIKVSLMIRGELKLIKKKFTSVNILIIGVKYYLKKVESLLLKWEQD